MAKRISMATKPGGPTPDQWVSGDASTNDASTNDNSPATPAPSEEIPAMKRLTLDIPEALHTRIKSQCALRRAKMVDEIRTLLENHFPE